MKKVKLGDIIKIYNGKAHQSLEEVGNFPVFGSGGLMGYTRDFIYNGEAILLPRKGTLSNIQYLNNKFWVVDTTYYAVVDKEKANTYFVWNYLKTLNLANLNSGSAVPSMTQKAYQDIEISLPDLPTQTAIARILSSLDDKIELNNKINKELESLARTIYEYWFVQNAGEKWERKSLGEYIQSTGGFAFKSTEWKNEGYPTIKIKDIQEDNTLNFNGIDYVSKDTSIDDKFVAKAGEVVIAMTGATIGKVAVVPFHSDKIYVNQRVGIFKSPNPLEKLPFLINSLNQNYVREMIFLIASGAAQPNISNEQINSIPLVIPNEELIKKYNDMMKSSYIQILNNQQENVELARLRGFLLPLLMNGQVASTSLSHRVCNRSLSGVETSGAETSGVETSGVEAAETTCNTKKIIEP